MANVGTNPTTTTTGSGVGNAFPFNRGNDPEPVAGVPAPDTGVDAPAEGDAPQISEAELQAREEASRHGWMDQDAWEAAGNDPSRWRPAPEFLDVRRGVKAIVQEENAALKAKLAALEGKLNERERRESEAQGKFTLETLQLERKQARENGDWNRVDELDNQIIDLKVKQTTAPPPSQPAMAPEMQETLNSFRRDNPVFFRDPSLNIELKMRLRQMAEIDPTINVDTALKEAKRMVMRDNPDKFRARVNGDVRRTAMSEMGGSGGADQGSRNWNNLTPTVRKVFEDTMRQHPSVKKEDLLREADDKCFVRR